jgi:hypothetical protein
MNFITIFKVNLIYQVYIINESNDSHDISLLIDNIALQLLQYYTYL